MAAGKSLTPRHRKVDDASDAMSASLLLAIAASKMDKIEAAKKRPRSLARSTYLQQHSLFNLPLCWKVTQFAVSRQEKHKQPSFSDIIERRQLFLIIF